MLLLLEIASILSQLSICHAVRIEICSGETVPYAPNSTVTNHELQLNTTQLNTCLGVTENNGTYVIKLPDENRPYIVYPPQMGLKPLYECLGKQDVSYHVFSIRGNNILPDDFNEVPDEMIQWENKWIMNNDLQLAKMGCYGPINILLIGISILLVLIWLATVISPKRPFVKGVNAYSKIIIQDDKVTVRTPAKPFNVAVVP